MLACLARGSDTTIDANRHYYITNPQPVVLFCSAVAAARLLVLRPPTPTLSCGCYSIPTTASTTAS